MNSTRAFGYSFLLHFLLFGIGGVILARSPRLPIFHGHSGSQLELISDPVYRSAFKSIPRGLPRSQMKKNRMPSVPVSSDPKAFSKSVPVAQVDDSFQPKPNYPLIAQEKRWEGKVIILLETDEEGHVQSEKLEESSGFYILDQAALEGVKRWKLKPNEKFLIPVIFKLKEEE